MRNLFLSGLFLFLPLWAWCQTDSTEIHWDVGIRITEEEIRLSGARDLVDVLRLVPGFAFAVGEEGRLGAGFRGTWAEGKIRVEVDGQMVNDLFTGGVTYGNHFPVEMIKEIEIVKGPSSITEGLFAQQGVIRIHTYNGADQSGFSLGYAGGRMEGGANRSNQRIYVGKNGRNTSVNFSIFRGRAQRSAGDIFAYQSPDNITGKKVNLAGYSDLDPAFTQFHFRLGKFRLQYARDYYDVTDVTRLDSAGIPNIHPSIQNNLLTLSHNWQISPKITLSPQLNGIIQFSRFRGLPDSVIRQMRNHSSNQLSFLLTTHHKTETGKLLYGLELWGQGSNRVQERPWVSNDNRVFGGWQGDVFFESFIRRSQLDFSPGIRLGVNNVFGKLLTARMGFHRAWQKWDFRLVGGNYLRIPTAGNFALSYFNGYAFNKDSTVIDIDSKYLRPENALLGEFSLEWKPTPAWSFTLNLFRNTRRNTLEYDFFQDSLIRRTLGPQAGFEVYRNGPSIGTQGLETTVHYRFEHGRLTAGYSFYSPAGGTFSRANSVRSFSLLPSGRTLISEKEYLAFARHRFNLNLCYFLRKDLSVNLSGNYIGGRWGYELSLPSDQPGIPQGVLVRSSPTLLVNVFFHYKGWIYRGLDLGGGIYNLLRQEYRHYQPYFGNGGSLPGQSREIALTLSLDLGFREKWR
ncbi:MAG: TonB-dependent receptor plug domain-containing protein [Bacteroidia bacterium]|nr:TonB-dependent receptor plug domain-containing protein [Bacteroidia bacterium]